jgi:hypothetical protein
VQGRIYSVRFYYSPYLSADVYWSDESKRWAKQIDQEADPSGALKAAAAQITAGASTDEEKAQKLYEAVQALDNTSFSRAKTESERKALGLSPEVRNATQVWSEKSGTRNEMAVLYLALARAAGLNASAMIVSDRAERFFDPGYLSLAQLDVNLVVLHLNGSDVYLDPGEKLLPFGQLRWSHQLCGGLLETGNGVNATAVTPANATKDAITAHLAQLAVDPSGGVAGTVTFLMNGPAALEWRQMNLTTDASETERQLNEALNEVLPQGISGSVDKIQGIDTAAGYLSVTFKVSGRLGTLTGKRLLLPGFFFSTGAHTQFVAEAQRETPVDLEYPGQVINDVVYHLPAGATVESAPQPTELTWAQHAALVVKTQPGPGTIDIKHIFARGFALLDPREYPALRDYYEKIAANDQQQLVLQE